MNDGMFAAVQNHFRENGVTFATMEGSPVLLADFGNRWGGFHCMIQVDEESGTVQVHTVVPLHVPPALRLAAAEFLTRANFKLRIGNFELDMNDGQVRYKTSICVGDCAFSPDLMVPLMAVNLSTADRYMPGLIAVVHENAPAAEAIAHIEEVLRSEQEGPGESAGLPDGHAEDLLDQIEAALDQSEPPDADGPEQAPAEAPEQAPEDPPEVPPKDPPVAP